MSEQLELIILVITIFMFISIPFASLKAQNVMKQLCHRRYFYYSKVIGITVNYKSRGGEWATLVAG
jgi:hypothetical protein